MPRATLIHNVGAGDGRPTGAGLRELVERQGYEPVYATTDDDLDAVLQDPGDLVVVAGGDGTVGRVAAILAGRHAGPHAPPIAILPIGTANNVAASVHAEGPIDLLASGWRDAAPRRVDVVTARGPWGHRTFVESCGFGAFAHAMPIISALKKGQPPATSDDAIRHDRRALLALLRRVLPRPLHMVLDGETVTGEVILAEFMNGPLCGPRLHLAPGATPGDGMLELVLVSPDDRDTFADWVAGDPGTAWSGPGRSVRGAEIHWDGQPLHIDGDAFADSSAALDGIRAIDPGDDPTIHLVFEAAGVQILAPNRRLDERAQDGRREASRRTP